MSLQSDLKDRTSYFSDFLFRSGLGDSETSFLAGDASFRKYYRITSNGNPDKILMDAPPEYEDIAAFINIGNILQKSSCRSPKIYHADHNLGFLILEDFGDKRFSTILTPDNELELYKSAIKILIHLHKYNWSGADISSIPPYDMNALMKEVMLLPEWYLEYAAGTLENRADATKEYQEIWQRLLAPIANYPDNVLVLRDYHVDNLMLLEDQESDESLSRIGLLDFQDALLGHPAYDVMSLLEDARRNVSAAVIDYCYDLYIREMGHDDQTFHRDYVTLALQRHCKVLGIFVRLSKRDGKDCYLKHIPRLLQYIENHFSNMNSDDLEYFAELKHWLERYIFQNRQKKS